MKTRNVTLTIPEDLLRRLKIIAAKQETSISATITKALLKIADEENGYAEAQRGMLENRGRLTLRVSHARDRASGRNPGQLNQRSSTQMVASFTV